MVRAWRGRASCATPDQPLAWLLTITRNEARRHHARRREEPVAEIRTEVDHGASGAVERVAARIDIQRALGRLTPHERALVVLRYGAELTQPEVAARLGLPEGTAKVQLHRVRIRLREQLQAGRG
jgi:RNA polymerase sigma-70 factor (ECF subfamily)